MPVILDHYLRRKRKRIDSEPLEFQRDFCSRETQLTKCIQLPVDLVMIILEYLHSAIPPPAIPQDIQCSSCHCKEFPSCCKEEEFCETCIDGACGNHLRLTANGQGIADSNYDDYECDECGEFFPEDMFLEHSCDESREDSD